MAPDKTSQELHWFRPEMRGILPLDKFRVPRSLKKFMRRHTFDLSFNQDFAGTIRACAEREETWINPEIIELYTQLHHMGHAHSVECRQDGVLVGGLYGVQLGGAFFGESMFSRTRNASKTALVTLVEHLNANGFMLLDAQYSNDHLQQFGVVEMPAATYERKLEEAIRKPCKF